MATLEAQREPAFNVGYLILHVKSVFGKYRPEIPACFSRYLGRFLLSTDSIVQQYSIQYRWFSNRHSKKF